MLNSLSAKLATLSTRTVVIVSSLVFLYFIAVVLPNQTKRISDFDVELQTIDLGFFYTPEMVWEMAEAYGEDGRRAAVTSWWTFDVAWPLAYTAFLVSTISALARSSKWEKLNLLPIGAWFFDLLENTCGTILVSAYPTELTWLAWVATAITMIKWLFAYSSFGALFWAANFAFRQRNN